MSLIHNCHSSSFERASIDEAYVDLTDEVNELLTRLTNVLNSSLQGIDDDTSWDIGVMSQDCPKMNRCCPALALFRRRPPVKSPSHDATKTVEWTLDWVAWLDDIDAWITVEEQNNSHVPSISGCSNTRPADEITKMMDRYRRIWDVVFDESLIRRLSHRDPSKSQVVRRVTGESILLKNTSPEGM